MVISLDQEGGVRSAAIVDGGPSDRIERVVSDGQFGAMLVGSTRRAGPTLEDPVRRADGWLLHVGSAGQILGSITAGGELDDYFNDATAWHQQLVVTGPHKAEQDFSPPMIISNPFDATSPCSDLQPLPVSAIPMPASSNPIATELQDLTIQLREVDIDLVEIAVTSIPGCHRADEGHSQP